MNYYLMFSKFEKGEGSFSIESPWRPVLNYFHPQFKCFKKSPCCCVDDCYDKRGMSDCLKIGIGMLARSNIQQLFFDHGFTGIQFIPVEVENDGIHHDYAFMNAVAHYDLFDPLASEAEDFNENLGGFTSAFDEIIDPDKLANANIEHDCFTLTTYKDPYYVNERVKDALEAAGVTGIEFLPMEFS
jgi:hypothetical protein